MFHSSWSQIVFFNDSWCFLEIDILICDAILKVIRVWLLGENPDIIFLDLYWSIKKVMIFNSASYSLKKGLYYGNSRH
jgi:hypothetical protein